MRLAVVEHGHRLRHKLILGLMAAVSRTKPADVMKTIYYRPEFFGAPSLDLTQAVMRGPSDWSAGERELFAAFTSQLNKCRF